MLTLMTLWKIFFLGGVAATNMFWSFIIISIKGKTINIIKKSGKAI